MKDHHDVYGVGVHQKAEMLGFIQFEERKAKEGLWAHIHKSNEDLQRNQLDSS